MDVCAFLVDVYFHFFKRLQWQANALTAVEYTFLGENVVPVEMVPHVNTKRNDRLYIRTQHSNLEKIKVLWLPKLLLKMFMTKMEEYLIVKVSVR